MDYESKIEEWLWCDKQRVVALELAAELTLNDGCLAAGFVRNLVWDRLHGDQFNTPLNDIDLIFFDSCDCSEELDRKYESILKSKSDLSWSVKNQARMHGRNNDAPYKSTSDAMSYWVELEAAVGVRLLPNRKLEFIAPFSCEPLFGFSITINSQRKKPEDFVFRVASKSWLSRWPRLIIKS